MMRRMNRMRRRIRMKMKMKMKIKMKMKRRRRKRTMVFCRQETDPLHYRIWSLSLLLG